MNRQEFISQIKSLLRVSKEDEASIIEEYEAYFAEAMANGETEDQIITNLESPEEIANNANEELGVNFDKSNFKDYVDIQFEAVKDGYEKVVDSDFVNNISDSVEEALKGVGETIKGLDIESKVSKALEKVGASLGKIKDVNFESAFKDMAMKFDNSKVETFDYDSETLVININDENTKDILNLEVIGGTSNLVIKSLPTTMKHDLGLEGEALSINVPASNIKYAEKKRMRIYVPNSVEKLKVESNVPMSLKDIEASLNVEVGNNPLTVKDIDGEEVVLVIGNAPVSVKDIETVSIKVTAENGPITFKDIQAEKGELKVGNGPLSVKDGEIDEFILEAGSGPQTIKFMEGENHSYKLGAGPKTIKNIECENITIESHGGLMTIKDITATKLAGDITGTVKTLKNIEVEDFEMNK